MDQTCRFWILPSSKRPVKEAESLARLLSSRLIDSTGGFVRLGAAESFQAWTGLREACPQEFLCSPREISAWQSLEAEEGLDRHFLFARLSWETRQWDSVIFHASRLIDVDSTRWNHCWWRGDACAELGRLHEALADYREVLARCPDQMLHQSLYALLLVTTGDLKRYRDFCKDLVERMQNGAMAAVDVHCVSMTCSFAPDSLEDFSASISAAPLWMANLPGGVEPHRDFGVILYRACQFEKAIEELNKSIELSQQSDVGQQSDFVAKWIFLACCHQKLGQVKEARIWLDKINKWHGEHGSTEAALNSATRTLNWGRRLLVKMIFREVEPLLGKP